jgi:hypothetical protein
MKDCEAKRNMTSTGLDKHGPNNVEELPVVPLHGTSGQSEDSSQVVEQLTRHRPLIRLNYAEPVAGGSCSCDRRSCIARSVEHCGNDR